MDGLSSSEAGSSERAEAREIFQESAENRGPLPCPADMYDNETELPVEASKEAEKTVRKQNDGDEASPELSCMEPVAESRSPDLAMAGNIALMDIHDLMSGKPLPPVMDDPYDTHMGSV